MNNSRKHVRGSVNNLQLRVAASVCGYNRAMIALLRVRALTAVRRSSNCNLHILQLMIISSCKFIGSQSQTSSVTQELLTFTAGEVCKTPLATTAASAALLNTFVVLSSCGTVAAFGTAAPLASSTLSRSHGLRCFSASYKFGSISQCAHGCTHFTSPIEPSVEACHDLQRVSIQVEACS